MAQVDEETTYQLVNGCLGRRPEQFDQPCDLGLTVSGSASSMRFASRPDVDLVLVGVPFRCRCFAEIVSRPVFSSRRIFCACRAAKSRPKQGYRFGLVLLRWGRRGGVRDAGPT
jgi:hypothetical protein